MILGDVILGHRQCPEGCGARKEPCKYAKVHRTAGEVFYTPSPDCKLMQGEPPPVRLLKLQPGAAPWETPR
jgi:hypothetical protein